MNFLGPIGLVVALIWVADWVVTRFYLANSGFENESGVLARSWFARLIQAIDYRLILTGSLLPDLIDKPLAFAGEPEFVNHSLRSLGHSAVGVVAMIVAVSFVSWRWHRISTISFALALVGHLVMDQMWLMQEVLFWPTRGYVLTDSNIPFSHWYRIHFTQTPTSWLDLLGIGLLILFTGYLIGNRSLGRLLKTGRFS